MAAPEDEDIKYYFGNDGNPDNDEDPVGGTIDTGSVIDDSLSNNLIYNPTIGPTERTLVGLAYRKNEASGTWANAKFHNRCGGIAPSGTGVASLQSTDNGDVGNCWLAYKHGSIWKTEEVTLAGALAVTGLTSWDTGTDWMAIFPAGAPAGDVSLSVAGQTIGVFYGTANGGRSFCITNLWQVAVATAQDADISAADRTGTGLTGLGSFGPATNWAGLDNRIAIPGTDLEGGHLVGYGLELRIPGNFPKPPNGLIQADVNLPGDPEA